MSCFALPCSRTSTTSFRSPNTSISSSASNLFGNNAGQTPKQKSSTLPARAKWRTIEINLLSFSPSIDHTGRAHFCIYISLAILYFAHSFILIWTSKQDQRNISVSRSSSLLVLSTSFSLVVVVVFFFLFLLCYSLFLWSDRLKSKLFRVFWTILALCTFLVLFFWLLLFTWLFVRVLLTMLFVSLSFSGV